MLAAALAAGLGSFALGETDLLRVSIVIVVVCVLTWACAFLLGARVRTEFRCEPPEAPVDSTVDVRVQTRITRPLMPAAAVCHVLTPAGLGDTNHFAVPAERLRRGIRLSFGTTVRERGVHTFGPLEVTMRDPLGLVGSRYLGTSHARIVGLPRRFAVHAAWLQTIGVEPLTPSMATEEGVEGEPDAAVREHRPEDGLRRIHWRTSARTGRLMTRLDHPEADKVAVIAYESRAHLHRGDTFERTLEIVASLAAALLRMGWDLRLVDSAGERPAPSGGWDTGALLRFLALTEPVTAGTAPPLPADRTPVLVVTTDLDEHRPEHAAQTIWVPLPGRHAAAPPGVDALTGGVSVAGLLGTPPRARISA